MKWPICRLFLFIIGFITTTSVKGLADIAPPGVPIDAVPIVVDLTKRTVDVANIPFDKGICFTGVYNVNIHRLKIVLVDGIETSPSRDKIHVVRDDSARGSKTASFPNGATFNYTLGMYDFRDDTFLKARNFKSDYLLPDHPYTLYVYVIDTTGKADSFYYSFYPKVKAGDFAKLDFGIAFAPMPKALFPFTSVHLYFTPINDQTDLWEIRNLRRNIFLRASIFLGIAPSILTSDTKQPMKNEFGAGDLIFGIGFRSPFYWHYPNLSNTQRRKCYSLLQPMRIVVGEILFKQTDADSLIPKDRSKLAPYFGLSYDLNISSILGPIGKLLGS